ncbi:MAG TPA: DUF2156 domain-containing protein [Candidatus Coprenecus stercorigallinarum]|nr:DUF2156 domain-containing protein [Candidatus Coprenecus stercorigallinarum]
MSNLPQFKDIELNDKEWADPLLAVSDYRATEYCFTSLYIWARFFGTRIAKWKDWLLIRSDGEEGCANYIFPAGSGDIREVLGIMEEDAANIGRRMVLWTTAEVRNRIEEALPGHYGFSPIRRSFDYIYETGKMISLSGKKYQPKRNFISRFKTQNPDWTYESICPDGDPELCRRQLEECRAMTDEWCALNGCIHDESMQMEACAVRKALEDFIPLKLRGGMLRAGGRLVAYTLGERLNSDTFIVHVEKAFSDVTGAYPMISRTFLEHEAAGLQYVNREDDAGDEGLRKAKLSWNPAYMLEKYLAVPQ